MRSLWCLPFVLMACGGGSSKTIDAAGNGSGSNGGGGACTLTLSGAQTGSYSCTAMTAWASSNNQGGFSLSVSGFTGMITVGVGWPGEPMATTYHSTDANAKGGASVVTGSGAGTMAWTAAVGNGNTIGSYMVTFSSVANPITTSQGKGYTAHGSFSATLMSQTGQSGTIMMSATF